ncbi:hypothetical protein CAI21_15440 [Alkalilimnicola ehrlichii]|uniref:Kinase n=1 Tax=Alkalilimnicola ehrlichii TaxID=351052 RepID=A0A3E0WT92_9GAMM|nr:AAA family ATPase [Alkalilimnicola ehrlichii]RFA27237.1 hypothetical protein CAI21_15440 [Alkalilimnicola ehrlichii]RFA35413.1 hypothetical protein CAL65_13115 [Alkalilimnicola ehrlichii]
MEAILLIGIQGAGKSTFYKEYFFDTHVRISLDLLRTHHRERRLLAFCLETRQRFVVDKINHTAAQRAQYIAPALKAGFEPIGYFFEPDPKGSFRRNRQRAKPVPPAGLFGTLKNLEPPRYEEGFERLYRVTLAPAARRFQVSDVLS